MIVELGVSDFSINLVGPHQLFMGASTNNFTLIQDDDLIRIHDGPDPLGHNQDRSILRDGFEAAAQNGIRLIVQGRERVIKDIDIRFFHDGPSNRQALLLPA